MEPTVNHIWPCLAKQTGQNAALEVLHDFAPDTLLAKSHTGAKMCQTLRAKDWCVFFATTFSKPLDADSYQDVLAKGSTHRKSQMIVAGFVSNSPSCI